jgi:hypothetical protein
MPRLLLSSPPPSARKRLLASAGRAFALGLLVAGAGCEDINWPFHHRQTAPVPAAPADQANPSGEASQSDDECADLLGKIRQSQEERREAIATSVSPDIVSAAQGKADQRIEDLRRRYDELDCPSDEADATTRPHRQPPLQPAPGAANH